MTSQFQTPRINKAVLEQYVGHTVCVVGKVVSHDEGASDSIIETSDRQQLTVKLAAGTTWSSQYVEVIGHLHEDHTVQEFKTTELGDSFDMATYEKTLQLMTGKYSYLFYGAQE